MRRRFSEDTRFSAVNPRGLHAHKNYIDSKSLAAVSHPQLFAKSLGLCQINFNLAAGACARYCAQSLFHLICSAPTFAKRLCSPANIS